jgi:NAD(P)-dependent dehydrogenase (short-subunit alcohol dehydrogenase family)
MAGNKAIVITGASSGIGEACALHLDEKGFHVFAGVRKEADGIALKRRASDRLQVLRLDITNAESIAAAAAQVAAAVGPAGVVALVNNAGIVQPGPLEFLPVDELRRVLEVNVVGHVATTQAFLPLIRQGKGRVVFVSSLSGRIASPMTGSYCASKFALEGLSDAWRMELRSSGIPVSIIAPGMVATPIWSKSLASSRQMLDAMPSDARARYAPLTSGVQAWAQQSSRRGIPMEKITRAVRHACVAGTPKARYTVGIGSRLFLLCRFLPDGLRDRMLLRAFGAAS